MKDEQLFMLLKSKGLSVSHQRLCILDYLLRHEDHPTCEMIYNGLKNAGNPTLSLATVYNNIRAFVDAGLVKELKIGCQERHYEIDKNEHSHFFCKECGKILNVNLTDALNDQLEEIAEHSVPDCLVESKHVSFSGLCPDCQSDEGSKTDRN